MPVEDIDVIVRYTTMQGIKGQFVCRRSELGFESEEYGGDTVWWGGEIRHIRPPNKLYLTAPGIRIECQRYGVEESLGGT